MPKFKFSTKKKETEVPPTIEAEKTQPVKKETFNKDPRLDKVMPLVTDTLLRLLGSAGMMRYRKDLIEKMKEVMDGK